MNPLKSNYEPSERLPNRFPLTTSAQEDSCWLLQAPSQSYISGRELTSALGDNQPTRCERFHHQ